MGNCLKTQLKESVQNDNLKKIGVLKVPVNAGTIQFNLKTPNEGDSTVKVVDSVNGTVNEHSSHTNDMFVTVEVPNGGYYEVTNKYAVIEGLAGNIFDNNREILPDISEFLYCNNLLSILYTFAKGNIKELAKIDSLINIYATYFTGDIKDYCATRYARTQSSGDIRFNIYSDPNKQYTTITFNGKTVFSNTYSLSPYLDKLHWENATKMYLLYNNHTSVYTLGYTDEEISTMREIGGAFERVSNDGVTKVD